MATNGASPPASKRMKLDSSLSDEGSKESRTGSGEGEPCSQQVEEPSISSSVSCSDPLVQLTDELSGTSAGPAEERYYLVNFKSILSMVLTSSPEKHVIANDAKLIVDDFIGLNKMEQHLYVRLFLRKHQWLRSGKISYADIASDLRPMLSGLVDHGFLVDESHLTDPSEVLSLLQLSELKDLRKQHNLPTSASGKSQIIECLFKHDRQYRPLFAKSQFLVSVVGKAKKKLGMCVKLANHHLEVFSKMFLLFSLTNSLSNGREEEKEVSQIIFKMLQVNVGTLKYPDYEVVVSQPLFKTVDCFQRYYAAVNDEQTLIQAIESKEDSTIDSVLKKSQVELNNELQRLQACTSLAISSVSLPNLSTRQCPGSSCSDEPSTLPPFLMPFTTGWLYGRLLSMIAEYFEKRGRYKHANDIIELLLSQETFCNTHRGRWWERLTLNYDYHLKEKRKCLENIKRALDDPNVRPPRRLSLLNRARKLCESVSVDRGKPRKSIHRQKHRKVNNEENDKWDCSQFDTSDFPAMELVSPPEVCISGARLHTDIKPVYFTESLSSSHLLKSSGDSTALEPESCTAMVGVEGYAMAHYSKAEGWPCVLHAEGSIFSTLFGVLMWSVIFMSGVPDVFRTPYQSAPLDLFSRHFYEHRKKAIDERLSWIKDASVEDIDGEIADCWSKNMKTSCVAVRWELFDDVEDMKSLAVCMGGLLLSRVCEEFSKDFRHSGSGLPDLTLWNPSTLSCKFVEVKGPGDRLSNKQILWLSKLSTWGCNVEVCRVKGMTMSIVPKKTLVWDSLYSACYTNNCHVS